MNDIRTDGPWPTFSLLGEGTILPVWLQQSADEIIAAHGDQLRALHVSMWGNYYYDDNSNYDLKADISPSWKDPQQQPSEDDLDHIPAMRRIMRRAAEVWDCIPFDLDSEGGELGELECVITRDGFDYKWNRVEYCEDVDFETTARWNGSGWDYEEKIIIVQANLSETARAISDTRGILSQIDPSVALLSKWPDLASLTHEFDENDDLVVIAKGGGLLSNFESSVA